MNDLFIDSNEYVLMIERQYISFSFSLYVIYSCEHHLINKRFTANVSRHTDKSQTKEQFSFFLFFFFLSPENILELDLSPDKHILFHQLKLIIHNFLGHSPITKFAMSPIGNLASCHN